MSSWAAVILAAGDGTSMNSRTPKVLPAICGQPMLSLAIRTARDAGLERFLAVVPHKSGAIRPFGGERCTLARI